MISVAYKLLCEGGPDLYSVCIHVDGYHRVSPEALYPVLFSLKKNCYLLLLCFIYQSQSYTCSGREQGITHHGSYASSSDSCLPNFGFSQVASEFTVQPR